MQRRAVRSLILGSLAALLLAVGPVAGKISYFSIEVSPSDPRDGDVVMIVVRLWDDARHTTPATWWPPEATIEGLIEARGPTGSVAVTLLPLGDDTYGAEVMLSEGTWRLVPFPLPGGGMASAGDGYPGPLIVTVGPAAAGTAGVAIAAGGALGLATVVLIVGGPIRRRLRRSLEEVSP